MLSAAHEAGVFNPDKHFLTMHVSQPRHGQFLVHTVALSDGGSDGLGMEQYFMHCVPEFTEGDTNLLADARAAGADYASLGIVHWTVMHENATEPPMVEECVGVVATTAAGASIPERRVRSVVWKASDKCGDDAPCITHHPTALAYTWAHQGTSVPFVPWRIPVVLDRLRHPVVLERLHADW